MKKTGGSGVWDAVMITAGFWVLGASLWLQIGYLSGTLERIATGSMEIHVDFDSFWRSARAMLEGQDIYDTGVRLVNLNPPVWTALISPLGLLEPLTAYRVFVLISLVIVVAYLAWTVEELRLRPGWTAVRVLMLLLSSPLLATLALGQVYPVLALGLVAAWVADRRERDEVSGAALGLVVALKPCEPLSLAARAAEVEGFVAAVSQVRLSLSLGSSTRLGHVDYMGV